MSTTGQGLVGAATLRDIKSFTRCLFIPMLVGMHLSSAQAYKITSPNAFCDLTEAELSNPDLGVRVAIENLGSTKCARVPEIEDWKPYYKSFQSFPIAARKNNLPEEYAAVYFYYRDFKIKGKKPGPLVDGRPTLLYEVELLYVLMHVHEDQCFEGERCGEIIKPLCEKATAYVQMGNTPWGWFKLPSPDIGHNFERTLVQIQKRIDGRYKNNPEAQKKSRDQIDLYTRLAAECQEKL